MELRTYRFEKDPTYKLQRLFEGKSSSEAVQMSYQNLNWRSPLDFSGKITYNKRFPGRFVKKIPKKLTSNERMPAFSSNLSQKRYDGVWNGQN